MSTPTDNYLRLQETPPAEAPPPAGAIDFFNDPTTGNLIRRNSAGDEEIVGQDAFGYDPAVKLAKQFPVSVYGAKADGVTLYDGTFTSGQTAFTSATAAFTQADVGKAIVLQLSQGTRQILTIASVTNSTTIVLSAAASASSSAYTYGITTYGTDNSGAIQAAIDAAGQLGGEILLDGGTYLCTAAPGGFANSIFTFPHSPTAIGASPSVTIKGVSVPSFAFINEGQRPSKSGSIIYCPNSAGASGVEPAVFAVVPYDWNPGTVPNSVSYWGSTATMLSFEDLSIMQIPATKMHGIQDHLGGALYVNRCSLIQDIPTSEIGNVLINPATGGATACGIIPPSKLSAYWSKIENTVILGYVTGCRFTDNVRLDQVTFEMCDTAMEGTQPYYANGMSAGMLYVWRCRVILSGHVNASIQQINYESGAATGNMPLWAVNNTESDIDNYDGHIRGHIGIYVVQGNVGPRPAIVRASFKTDAEKIAGGAAVDTLVVYDLVAGKIIGTNNAESLKITPVTGTPSAPTLATVGAAGTTTYKYKIAHVMADGSWLVGPEATITTGNATLSSTNKIAISGIPYVPGSCAFRVYRTATSGSATLGMIVSSYGPSSAGNGTAADTGMTGDGVLPTSTVGRVWFANNSGGWDGATITGDQLFTGSLTSNGTLNTDNGLTSGKVRIGGSDAYPGIWFGSNASSPAFNNYSFLYDQSGKTIINGPPGGLIEFRVGNSTFGQIDGNGLAFSSDLTTSEAGKTLKVKSGTNALAGTVTLTAGAGTISSTALDANTVIVLTLKTISGTVGGQPYVSAITAGTSATLAGGGGSNNSTYNWVGIKVN